MAMTMYEVGVATPLRCMKCNNAFRPLEEPDINLLTYLLI